METAEEPQSCSRVIIFTWKIAGVNLRESMALPPHPTVPLPAAAAELAFRGKISAEISAANLKRSYHFHTQSCYQQNHGIGQSLLLR